MSAKYLNRCTYILQNQVLILLTSFDSSHTEDCFLYPICILEALFFVSVKLIFLRILSLFTVILFSFLPVVTLMAAKEEKPFEGKPYTVVYYFSVYTFKHTEWIQCNE